MRVRLLNNTGFIHPSADRSKPSLDVSGLATRDGVTLGVRDVKLKSPEARFGRIARDGGFQPLHTNWNGIGKARDLEAVTWMSERPGHCLAVEGSTYQHHKAHLYHMKTEGEGLEAVARYPLPDSFQEIEGIAERPVDHDTSVIFFGGRGGNGESGRVYWGSLGPMGLQFSPEGLEGVSVEAPFLAPDQRHLSELVITPNGQVLASACIDQGDNGPFTSSIYTLGHLQQGTVPIKVEPRDAQRVDGTKIEGLTITGNEEGLFASDDEARGGLTGGFQLYDAQPK